MSIAFPSTSFFEALKERMDGDPDCSAGLAPCEAYCGLAFGDQLYVLEFDGRSCSAIVVGGNEIDLDFVVAGTDAVWQQFIDAILREGDSPPKTLAALVGQGSLQVRSADDEGPKMAEAALPFLQVFLERARGLELTAD